MRIHAIAFNAIGPPRITQLIPQGFSGVTEVKFLRQLILWEYLV